MATRITQASLRKLLLAKKRIAKLEESVKATEEQISRHSGMAPRFKAEC
jgi:hypothetical protein